MPVPAVGGLRVDGRHVYRGECLRGESAFVANPPHFPFFWRMLDVRSCHHSYVDSPALFLLLFLSSDVFSQGEHGGGHESERRGARLCGRWLEGRIWEDSGRR